MDDLRYPIGEFKAGAFLSDERQTLIVQMAEAPVHLVAAVKGLTAAQFDTPYRPEGWTVRQVVHHLADGHLNWYIRTKLALTEEEPTIKPFNETLWAELDDARTASVELSLALFEGLQIRWAQFFDSLKGADWSRKFIHPERGTLTIEDTLRIMAWHCRHHTAHITELRKRMDWK